MLAVPAGRMTGELRNGHMAKKRVEFDAHKSVKKPARVSFTTTSGKRVKFEAERKVKVPVRVKFSAEK